MRAEGKGKNKKIKGFRLTYEIAYVSRIRKPWPKKRIYKFTR